MNHYTLSRAFWDFAFENTGKIKPNHVSLYFFAMEHNNRLGWKRNFGLPTSMVLDAIGIKSYSVYKKAFDELVEFGFIEVIEYSKNQYSSNVIALKENCKANCKALDKALIKHSSKHSQSIIESNPQSTIESTVSIDKQVTKNNNRTNVLVVSDETTSPTPGDYEKLKEEIKDSEQKVIVEAIKVFLGQRPNFIGPYVDYWNLAVKGYGIPQVMSCTDKRSKKMKTRLKEPEFDFIAIVREIRSSLKANPDIHWFNFDFVVESQGNYVKILEGNYNR